MAIECSTESLLAASKCFLCLSPKQREAMNAYLLAVATGIDPDPQALMDDAIAYMKLNPKQAEAVQAYLLCQANN